MYQVIARKYRPAQFSELISQEHVRTTLENAIKQGRIAHGYILSGQRGTGKTTVARIIARCLNCVNGPTPTPCGECSSCREIAAGSSVDVIEIDAASNRGINEMRELRENVRYRPARDRFKVFIVDEAHQITSEAFNALLKTLEEPPEWVVFILCTTESHKIPVTITSRCQQFSFRSVDFGELMTRMRWICEQEGISTDEEVLGILAQAGEGSVRDSLSALDQAIACCGTTLSAPDVRELMGLFSLESLRYIADALRSSDSKQMLEVVGELERNGRSLHHFCRELARYFRNLLVARIAGGETRLIGASAPEQARLLETAQEFSEEDLTRYLQLTLDLYKDMQTSLQPRLHLEIGLMRLVHAGRLASLEQVLAGGALPTGGAASKVPPGSGPTQVSPSPPRPGPSPFERDSAKRVASVPASAPAQPPPATPGVRPEPDAGSAPPWDASSAAVAAPVPAPILAAKPAVPAPREQQPVSSQPSDAAPSASTAPARAAGAPAPAVSGTSDLRAQLIATLEELDRPHAVDNLDQASVEQGNGELVITVPPAAASMLVFFETDLTQAAQKMCGRSTRVRIVKGEANLAPVVRSESAPRRSNEEEEAVQRAMADPAVQSFREAFPAAEIRQVRNLKE